MTGNYVYINKHNFWAKKSSILDHMNNAYFTFQIVVVLSLSSFHFTHPLLPPLK